MGDKLVQLDWMGQRKVSNYSILYPSGFYNTSCPFFVGFYLCLMFGCGSLNTLPSAAGGTLSNDDWARHLCIWQNIIRDHFIDFFFGQSCLGLCTINFWSLAIQVVSSVCSLSWYGSQVRVVIGWLFPLVLSHHCHSTFGRQDRL